MKYFNTERRRFSGNLAQHGAGLLNKKIQQNKLGLIKYIGVLLVPL